MSLRSTCVRAVCRSCSEMSCADSLCVCARTERTPSENVCAPKHTSYDVCARLLARTHLLKLKLFVRRACVCSFNPTPTTSAPTDVWARWCLRELSPKMAAPVRLCGCSFEQLSKYL